MWAANAANAPGGMALAGSLRSSRIRRPDRWEPGWHNAPHGEPEQPRRPENHHFTCVFETGIPAKWVILDGLVPVIVDAATGDWKELQTDVCNATLTAGEN